MCSLARAMNVQATNCLPDQECNMALRLIALTCLVLPTLSGPLSAQTEQDEKLKQVISNLHACVRANAPDAEAAGIPKSGELIEFFKKRCLPLLVFTPGQDVDPSLRGLGALPPGIYPRSILEEWAIWTREARPR